MTRTNTLAGSGVFGGVLNSFTGNYLQIRVTTDCNKISFDFLTITNLFTLALQPLALVSLWEGDRGHG